MWTQLVLSLFWINFLCITSNEMLDQTENLFVEKEIQNYLNEVKNTLGLEIGNSKMKRNADFIIGRVYGTDVLSGFEELAVIPAQFPNDIILFTTSKSDGETWYAVALESDGDDPQTSYANKLVVYKFNGQTWLEVYSIEVNGGICLTSLEIHGNIYIVVAEHFAGTSNEPIDGSHVYLFNETNYTLQYVQLLNTKYASHVIMWERTDMNEVFLAVTTAQNYSSYDDSQYSSQSIVYHWLGGHFDIVDDLPSNDPRSIAHFNIGSFMFLAVANYQDNLGNTNIDSEIFRYDLNTGKFIIHQKLGTNAAVDIKYFCFESPSETESFLIIANNFEKDEEGNINYEANSIIYKLSKEQYFIPFQSIKLYAVRKWIPIFHDVGETSAFFLLAICEEGVVAFQYDGWRFVKSPVQYSQSWFGRGVASIHPFNIGNKTVFALANKNNPGNGVNIFNANFIHDSRMDEFYQDMEDWCQLTLQEIQTSQIEELVEIADHAPKADAEEVVFHSNNMFSNVDIETIKTDVWLSDDNNVVDSMRESLNSLNLELIKPQTKLEEVERRMDALLAPSTTIYGPFELDKVLFECPHGCNFSVLDIGNLNGEDMTTFMMNLVTDIGELRFNEVVEFENLAVQNSVLTVYINNHPVDTLIDWSQTNYMNDLHITGSVFLKSALNVNGLIDGVRINEESVWALNEKNALKGVLQVDAVEVESLTINGSMNGWSIGPNSALYLYNQLIDELNTSELILPDKLLAGVDLANLNIVTLKNNVQDQNVYGNHYYERMVADNVMVEGFIDKISPLEEYQISNGIEPPSGLDNMNMLRKSASEIEGVDDSTSRKSKLLEDTEAKEILISSLNDEFETVDSLIADVKQIMSPSMKAVMLDSGVAVDDYESYEIIDEDKMFQGAVNIKGAVFVINGCLTTDDLISSSNMSAKSVLEKGLRLNETSIQGHLRFVTPFTVNELNTETINNIPLDSLVPINASSMVTITGHKTFPSLHLDNGYIVTGSVNNINISELMYGTLQTNRDQEVTASLDIGSISAKKINSQHVQFNNFTLEDLTLIKNGTIHFKSVDVEGDVDVKSLIYRGNISDVNVEHMLQDSIFINDESLLITGSKHFTNLEVNSLSASSITDLDTEILAKAYNQSNIWNSNELNLDYPIKVEHISYTGNLDGIDAFEFGEWLLTEGDQDIPGQQTVKNIQAEGGLQVVTLNHVHIDTLLSETRRVDVNETIDHAVFNKDLVVIDRMVVDGKFQDIDLAEVVLHEKMQTQVIKASKTLSAPLIVNGSLYLNGGVNGFGLSTFCQRLKESSTKLKIEGSAMLESEPIVSKSVNGYDLEEILQAAWFTDENIIFNHSLDFKKAQFSNITLKGNINGIKLENFLEKYFSKTLNQSWPGNVHFSGSITMHQNLIAPSATVGGMVSGQKIEQLKDRVMLDGEAQVVEGILDFGNVEIKGLFTSTGLLNGLNLGYDVMRLDVPVNLVTGHKRISSIDVVNLDMQPGSKLQDIDLEEWDRLAVKTSGDFVIKGQKTFDGVFNSLSNIRVDGLVNGVPFDATHVMHSSSQQTVTGHKVFDKNSTLYIKDLEISGLMNDINVTDLFLRQIYTDSNATITGRKTFTKVLEAEKVIFEKNDDLIEIERQLNTPLPQKEFQDEKKRMHSVEESMKKSLKENKLYVRRYIRHMDLEGTVLDVMPIKSSEGSVRLVVVQPMENMKARMIFYQWNSSINAFNKSELEAMYLNKRPTSVQPFRLRSGKQSLIITHKKDINDSAEVILFNNKDTPEYINTTHRFSVPPKSSILHFEGRKLKCYIVTNQNMKLCEVYCYTARIALHKISSFSCNNVTQASVISTIRNIYLTSIQLNKTLNIYVWSYAHRRFDHLISQSFLNPVSVDSISHGQKNFIAVANQHLVGNKTPESVDIYRLNDHHEFILFQKLPIVSPRKLAFAYLPTSELMLYIITENKATPFMIFVYRGIAGFQLLHVEETLPLVTNLVSMTDEERRHFVIVRNETTAMILQAHLE